MQDNGIAASVRAAAGPVADMGAAFMLHPETFAESTEHGYPHPLAGYFAGRGGVLGAADGEAVAAAFALFEPGMVRTYWEQGLATHAPAESAARYFEQVAGFARRHLAEAEGLERLAELAERVTASAPALVAPLFAGWRRMPTAQDPPARALQAVFVLRELRADLHFAALALSGLTPVEAHMLNKGEEYTKIFGFPEPFADGAGKEDLRTAAEEATDRRMTEIVAAALTPEEAAELARLATAAHQVLEASCAPTAG